MGAQVALAVTLLAGAGLLLRSFQELGTSALPASIRSHVLTFQVVTPGARPPTKSRQTTAQRILDGLRAVPGVESAASSCGPARSALRVSKWK